MTSIKGDEELRMPKSQIQLRMTEWAPVVSLLLLILCSAAGLYAYSESLEQKAQEREARFQTRVDQMEVNFTAKVDKSISKLETGISNYARTLELNRIDGDIKQLTYAPQPLTDPQKLLLADLQRQLDNTQ